MLKCNVKGVESGYPLIIEAERIEEIEAEFNPGWVAFVFLFFCSFCLIANLQLRIGEKSVEKDQLVWVEVSTA